MLTNDAASIVQLPNENGEDAQYVSGMQGVIVITSMVEDLNQLPGENNPKPLYILAELVTPMDSFMPKVTISS